MFVAPAMEQQQQFPILLDTNAIGPASQDFRQKGETAFLNAVENSVYWSKTILQRKAFSRIAELAGLKSNWDSYGAPAPNQTAVGNSIRVLTLMAPFDLSAANIMASAEGGIGFCFTNGNRYADIELSNDGQIIGVHYIGMAAPVLIESDGTDDSIKQALAQIRNHVRV
jgi:hypothetical protein